MELLNLLGGNTELTRNQRLGHAFALILAVLMVVIGINLRSLILYETVEYFDAAAGIRVNYPAGWLIDVNKRDYIFQAQDTSRIGYKTTLQIQTVPIAPGMTPRNVLDDLSLFRANRLASYTVLFTQPNDVLPNGDRATRMDYEFVVSERNPFQESLLTVIVGRDILVIRRGQAILITFLTDKQTYLSDLELFQRILTTLDY